MSLSACSSTTSSVSSTAADSAVLTDLTNAKTAITAYQTVKGDLPAAVTSSELRDYSWSKSGEVKSLDYKRGSAGKAGTFCIIETSSTGHTMVVSSNSDATAGTDCPASY